jgi:RNA polymerase sigma-54 factor
VISAVSAPHITPDVRIRYDEQLGDYRVNIADGRTPNLRISNLYRRMLRNRDIDDNARDFLRRNLRSARWIVDAILQRRNTLERVVRAIIKFQREFFDRGPEGIQSLKMQRVADEVGLHVGTISRAVNDKYADTSWGIVPLRGFFTGGTQNTEGDDVSWNRVKIRLQELIAAEDKNRPMSDEEIVKRFHSEGINMARRTVAKYRKILKIPSSRRRRQY